MSVMTLTEKLEKWLSSGGHRIGEVSIRLVDGRFRLVNLTDADLDDSELESFVQACDVRRIVLYDDAGEFRPLKSAPGLRRGWVLWLADAAQLREALDYFYPAALGTWFAYSENGLESVALRELLGRQTGMYRYANRISDDGAQELVGKTCANSGGCLKRVCWDLEGGKPVTSLPGTELAGASAADGEMPLLCVEGCNWLVAKARKVSATEAKAAEAND